MHRARSSRFVSMRELGFGAGPAILSLPRISDLAVFAAWREAAGPLLEKVTRPVALDRGTLLVEVLDIAWMREIEGVKEQILGNLVTFAGPGRVRQIRLQVARARGREGASFTSRARGPAEPATREAAPDEASEDSGADVAAIRDEGLRRRFAAVARRYLRRG